VSGVEDTKTRNFFFVFMHSSQIYIKRNESIIEKSFLSVSKFHLLHYSADVKLDGFRQNTLIGYLLAYVKMEIGLSFVQCLSNIDPTSQLSLCLLLTDHHTIKAY